MDDFLVGIAQDIASGLILAAILFLIKKLNDLIKKIMQMKYKTLIRALGLFFHTKQTRLRGGMRGKSTG